MAEKGRVFEDLVPEVWFCFSSSCLCTSPTRAASSHRTHPPQAYRPPGAKRISTAHGIWDSRERFRIFCLSPTRVLQLFSPVVSSPSCQSLILPPSVALLGAVPVSATVSNQILLIIATPEKKLPAQLPIHLIATKKIFYPNSSFLFILLFFLASS